MADALCGPSNALSTFQKHSSVDRTLQQDRLVGQRLPEQGFRSAPGSNAGILDAEFEAFQNGPPQQLHDGFQQSGPVWPGQSLQPPQPQLSGWANDFQNMNLNDFQISPAASSRFQQYAPPQPTASQAAWHQEFLREPAFSQQKSQAQTPQQPFQRNINSFSLAQYPSTLAAQQYPTQESRFDQTQNQQPQQELDDALFEKHFAAAALEVDHTMGQAESQINPISADPLATTQQSQSFDTASLLGPSIQRASPSEPIIDIGIQDPIGSDRISNDRGKSKERDALDDGDELARTAGTLLENVKHDQSQKFKQSNFLSLMRQLRDREVKVEGDKFVDATQALHPGGDFYPTQQQEQLSARAATPSEGAKSTMFYEESAKQAF